MPLLSLLTTLGPAALSAGGSFLSGSMNSSAQRKADKKAFENQVALLQMEQGFSERMANTAHQREVNDLRAAGLNPILSATGGNGAPSPVVTAPTASLGSRQDHFNFDGLSQALKDGSEIGLNFNTAKKAKADADLAEAKAQNQLMENKITKAKVDFLEPVLDNAKNVSSSSYWDDVIRGVKEWFKRPDKQYYIEPNSSSAQRELESQLIEWAKKRDVIKSPKLDDDPLRGVKSGKRIYYKDLPKYSNEFFNSLTPEKLKKMRKEKRK